MYLLFYHRGHAAVICFRGSEAQLNIELWRMAWLWCSQYPEAKYHLTPSCLVGIIQWTEYLCVQSAVSWAVFVFIETKHVNYELFKNKYFASFKFCSVLSSMFGFSSNKILVPIKADLFTVRHQKQNFRLIMLKIHPWNNLSCLSIRAALAIEPSTLCRLIITWIAELYL